MGGSGLELDGLWSIGWFEGLVHSLQHKEIPSAAVNDCSVSKTHPIQQELLEFTQGLDFSKYIRDVEVQTMIDQVKKRIQEIEGQPEVDEGALEDDCNEDEGDGERSGRPLEEAEARLEVKHARLGRIKS